MNGRNQMIYYPKHKIILYFIFLVYQIGFTGFERKWMKLLFPRFETVDNNWVIGV